MTTLEALRRRKLVQWAIAYAAGAWVVLQVIGFLADSYEWPRAVTRVAIPVAVIGFFVTLVLAWYHGERGEQRVTRAELLLLVAIALGGGALTWWTLPGPRTDAAPAPKPTAELPTIERDPSIAVLPFVNMSDDKGNEYFSDGISEELLNLLAQVPKLRVIARTSSFAFKGQSVEIAEIARRLHVASVLEGSVRKSGDKVRITVQLIRAADSTHLWSETYDRTLDDIFKVQDEIAAAVVAQLKVKLLGAAPTAKPVDREAYTLFLQGRSVERQVTTQAFEQAIALYQQALAIDPAYADAWVSLARAYCNQAYQYRRPAVEAIPLARAAIDKALAADPEHAPAHAQIGWIETFHARNFAAAARHLERALSSDPTSVDVLVNAASLARRLRRFEQAVAIGRYIVEHDPVNAGAMDDLGYALLYAGRRDEGMASFRKALQLSPSFVGVHANIALLLLAEGDAKGAMAEAQQEPDPQFAVFTLAAAHWGAGDHAKSDALLQEAIDKYSGTAAYFVALVYNARGDADRTFEWLERTVKQRELEVGAIPVYPTFAPLYADPRWTALLRDAGVAPEQLAPIKFEVKLPEHGETP